MPTDERPPKIWLRRGLRAATANLIAGAALALLALFPAFVSASSTYEADVYSARSALYQDPDATACVAAAAQMMLNMTAYNANLSFMSSSEVFQLPMRWRADTTAAKRTAILAYSRANMTMLQSSLGTDPHGWRNALNYYGWGRTNIGVYRDSAYATFDLAAKAVVSSLARHMKPIGILARSGHHAQLVTGYVVTGEDPAVSDNYTISGVYITDPLVSAAMRDTYVPLETWRSGGTAVRFTAYMESDSPYQDGIDLQVGTTEWYGKWVILDALR
jgi:hypothetical protein